MLQYIANYSSEDYESVNHKNDGGEQKVPLMDNGLYIQGNNSASSSSISLISLSMSDQSSSTSSTPTDIAYYCPEDYENAHHRDDGGALDEEFLSNVDRLFEGNQKNPETGEDFSIMTKGHREDPVQCQSPWKENVGSMF